MVSPKGGDEPQLKKPRIANHFVEKDMLSLELADDAMEEVHKHVGDAIKLADMEKLVKPSSISGARQFSHLVTHGKIRIADRRFDDLFTRDE